MRADDLKKFVSKELYIVDTYQEYMKRLMT